MARFDGKCVRITGASGLVIDGGMRNLSLR